MMNDLLIDNFGSYFQAVHGYAPFPWQAELARQVVTSGKWPSLLDLPTSAGKTAVIDIGVFHLALEVESLASRRAPLRMFFVIDRRIVVDEAYKRAEKISAALRNPHHPVLKIMAERLARLSGDSKTPLDVVRLRGGMPQERDWARSPTQPLVAVSTVDQVGSRLLFRGYGVSDRMRPVHAGLVGADALWLLDEVHLSQPFEQTLEAIAKGHTKTDDPGLLSRVPRLAPFAVVKLSATPGSARPVDFFPGSFDIRLNAPDVFLKRLSASKRANLEETGADPAADFVRHILRHLHGELATVSSSSRKKNKASSVQEGLPVWRLAVVVNRVALARQIFEKLVKSVGDKVEVLLLTGRIRPLDRERIMTRLTPLLAGIDRSIPEKPIIVVATQTIEAGADLDVDALVTEIAPLDCLRQRFGRLDRLGLRGTSRAVVLCPPGKPAPKSDKATQRTCPWRRMEMIYGEAPFVTRQWLAKLKGDVDFGFDAMTQELDGLGDDLIEKMLAPRAQAPYLLPPYIGLWSTTSPVPPATPDPALFLHGPGTMPEVRVVWRADVCPDHSPVSLELCPPASSEALSLPLWVVRRWLHSQPDNLMADIPQVDPGWRAEAFDIGRVVLRDCDNAWEWISPRHIRPDDLIVVPAGYGGCDEWGWNPSWQGVVADRGVEAHYYQRLKCALRISNATLSNAWKHEPGLADTVTVGEKWRSVVAWLEEAGDDVNADTIARQIRDVDVLPGAWRALLTACAGRRMDVAWLDDVDHSAGFILYSTTCLPEGVLGSQVDRESEGLPSLTGQRGSSTTGVAVSLVDHCDHVEHLVKDFCARCGIVGPLAELLTLAARLHDLGKAEPRFQADLHGTGRLVIDDPLLAGLLCSNGELLAKSAYLADGQRGRGSRRGATPRFFRHEALSVALAKQHPQVMALTEEDRELLLWLIGTHHGYGRPFFPPCADLFSERVTELRFDDAYLAAYTEDSPIRMNQGWFELAERVQRRFGPWELSRLEAIVRLADHAASALEQQNEADGTENHHG